MIKSWQAVALPDGTVTLVVLTSKGVFMHARITADQFIPTKLKLSKPTKRKS